MFIFNSLKNKFLTNDGKEGQRTANAYKNKNLINDGKEGFRLVNGVKGADAPILI